MALNPYTKFDFEEFWIWHDFKRRDNYGWLENSESISSVEATLLAINDAGNVVNTTSLTSQADGTKAKVYIEGGTPGSSYSIQIKITTSTGQVFGDRIPLTVKE